MSRKFGRLGHHDPDQLLIDFAKAGEQVQEAVSKLVDIGKMLAETSGAPPEEFADDAAAAMRKTIVYYMNVIAYTRKVEQRTTWLELYHNVYKAYGVHAVVESTEKGFKTHLDAMEARGMLPEVLGEATKMMLAK